MPTVKSYGINQYIDFYYADYVVATLWLDSPTYYRVVLYTDRTLHEINVFAGYGYAYRMALTWSKLFGSTIVSCWRSQGII